MRPCTWLSAALAAALALPAQAVLTRADRDDDEYRELATRYVAAVAFEGREGAGALIAPRWVLTSAHWAQAMASGKPAVRVLVAGRPHAVQEVFVHPGWNGNAASDIALLFLRDAAAAEPAPIHRQADEQGMALRVVAFGPGGRIGGGGSGGPAGKPDPAGTPAPAARAFVNTVDVAGPASLVMRLKGPDDASDLQGALLPSESGAPGFTEVEGRAYVVGVAQAVEDGTGDGRTGGIGDRERYARVSAFASWIDDTMAKAALAEAAATPAKPARPAR